MKTRWLALYPEAWRERYGEEMRVLLEDTPPSLAATFDLLKGAALAHLRPLPNPDPATRARGTVTSVLGCFIVFCLLGSGFAKTTENDDYTEHLHPLLGVSHSVIVVGAIAAVGALAVAALPLALVSLAEARRTRERALLRLIAVPPVTIAMFAGSNGLLALWLSGHHHHLGLGGGLLLGLCILTGAAGSVACWAASRAIMRRVEIPRSAFAFAVPAAGLVALVMVAIAVATAAFLIGIVAEAPGVGASGNGPGQLIDVTTSIAIQLAGMLALSALAAVSAVRGLRVTRAW